MGRLMGVERLPRPRSPSPRRQLRRRRARPHLRFGSRELVLLAAMLLLALAAADQYVGLGRRDRAPDAVATDLHGTPEVTDGDTLRLNGVRVRIAGIDAPEMSSAEGRAAKRHLIGIIGEGAVDCRDTGERSYGRTVGVCSLEGGDDLAARMVAAGWAVDLPRFSSGRYAELQRQAQAQNLGMHAASLN